jgi:hypothetical protein
MIVGFILRQLSDYQIPCCYLPANIFCIGNPNPSPNVDLKSLFKVVDITIARLQQKIDIILPKLTIFTILKF